MRELDEFYFTRGWLDRKGKWHKTKIWVATFIIEDDGTKKYKHGSLRRFYVRDHSGHPILDDDDEEPSLAGLFREQ